MAISKRFMTSVVLLCAAALIAGCGSSSTSPEEVMEAPLLPPTSVMISRAGDSDILISWDLSTQPTLDGYNVYRASGNNPTFTRMNSTPIQTNRLLDTSTEYNMRYQYRVTSVNVRGLESNYASVQLFNNPTSGGGDKDKIPQL
jgi:fibronectin type 3 domain-containing protein